MNSRRFGVEIECGSDLFTYPEIRNRAQRLRVRGVRSVGNDGSGTELRTVPLQGRDGFKILQEIMQFLVDECGGYVQRQDGLHVHHDTPELVHSFPLQTQLVRSWYNNQNTIRTFVSPHRNINACPLWSAVQVNNFEQGHASMIRHALNIRSIRDHGTVELRLHEGTLDFDQAEAWVKFGQYFISNALTRKHPLPPLNNAELLLKRIRAPKAARVRYAPAVA